MRKKGKPKSQSEKCEVSAFFATGGYPFFTKVRQTGQVCSAIIAKLSPIKGEHIST